MYAARKNFEFLQHDFRGEFQPRKNLEKNARLDFDAQNWCKKRPFWLPNGRKSLRVNQFLLKNKVETLIWQ